MSGARIVKVALGAAAVAAALPKNSLEPLVIFQSSILQTENLRAEPPGELPVCWGISPLEDKILIESNP